MHDCLLPFVLLPQNVLVYFFETTSFVSPNNEAEEHVNSSSERNFARKPLHNPFITIIIIGLDTMVSTSVNIRMQMLYLQQAIDLYKATKTLQLPSLLLLFL